MKVLLFDELDKVDVAALQHDLLLLPPWRRRQVLAYRHLVDRVQCAKAFVLLRQCLSAEYDMHGMPVWEYGKYGKPMLCQSADAKYRVHFNLSHCAKGVMCVVDDEPVGCDIEVIPASVDADLLSACCCRAEQERILLAASPEVEFTRLWTKKEALLKLHGVGLVDDLPGLMASPMARDVVFSTMVCELKGYVYTIAQSIK